MKLLHRLGVIGFLACAIVLAYCSDISTLGVLRKMAVNLLVIAFGGFLAWRQSRDSLATLLTMALLLVLAWLAQGTVTQ